MRKTWLVILFCLAATPALAASDVPAQSGMTHRMMMLALQLGVILFAAKLGGILFENARLPAVLGELAAGMLIGPYALGQISFYGFAEGLFPLAVSFPISPELYGLSCVAAIVLLFVTGAETNIRLLARYSLAGATVGIGGVTVSFLLGDLTAMVFSGVLFAHPLGFFHPACLFLGVISTATSVGITARVLSERRKLDSPEGVTMLADAVIDDVLGIVLLAVVLGIVSATKATGHVDWAQIAIIAGKAIGIWLVLTALMVLASRRISMLLKLFRDRSSIAIMALALALILAGLFEEAGLAMIIGAYVAGLSISRMDISHVVRERLGPIYAFLVPVFFCVMGMLVDFSRMGSATVITFGAAYTVVAVIGKLLGCGIPAMFFNFNVRGALRIGVGMLPRGEVALVIAGIGLASGLFGQDVFGVAILMTLVTTLVAPPVLVGLFRNSAPGTRRPGPPEEGTVVTFEFASSMIAEFLLHKLTNIFEYEGFFVHLIHRDRQIYQLRKDSIIIGLERRGAGIHFNCDESDVTFVNTAVYEVLGDLEQTIRGLQKPVDRAAIVRRVQEATAPGGRSFDLARYLRVELVQPRLEAADKFGVIDELLDMLDRAGMLKDVAQARKAILAREESMPTGMERGIAIPHGRTDAVDELVCVIGIRREGVDFGAQDGQPSRIIILTLSPKEKPAPHVQVMATISRTFTPGFCEKALSAEGAEELREWIIESAGA